MPKDERPLDYERRVLDTKGLAQRVNLNYLREMQPLGAFRRRATVAAAILACLTVVPRFSRKTEGFYENGRLSLAHTMLESNCETCHSKVRGVTDETCKSCHDGPTHQREALGVPACADCHLEHRGKALLAQVDDVFCTRCHANLRAHKASPSLVEASITVFQPGGHPDFPHSWKDDRRPLKLNHAVHMKGDLAANGGNKVSLKCFTCHVMDGESPKGDPLPVTFERNCRQCHEQQLRFDAWGLLDASTAVAPHSTAETVMTAVVAAYESAVARNPAIVQRKAGADWPAQPGPKEWVQLAVSRSTEFLFQQQCTYCHELEAVSGGMAALKPVNSVHGRYVAAKASGEEWFSTPEGRRDAEFNHHAHRAIRCDSCHVAAHTSTRTADVLIPKMATCVTCHSRSGTTLDRCAHCHLYHDKREEVTRDGRPIIELVP